MKKLPYGKYSKELRLEAVKLIETEKISICEASRRLSIPGSTLAKWMKAKKEDKLKDIGKNRKELSEVELELARVKKELAQSKMEIEILKKAAAYFAKESLENTR